MNKIHFLKNYGYLNYKEYKTRLFNGNLIYKQKKVIITKTESN